MARQDEETAEITIVGGRAERISEATLKRDRASLIVIAGENVGEMFSVGGGLVIGRGDVDVRVIDEEISRRHARIAVHGKDVFLEDLGSRNGTYLNGVQVRREILRDGDKIQIGSHTVLRFALHDSLEESFQKQMCESALRDPLTGAYNRKYLLDRLQSELAYANRHGTPLSFLLLDVDRFKSINDAHGHPAGDVVLVELARHVQRVIRTEDVFARYGGEEFGVLSRGIAIEGARKFAERLRHAIEGYPFAHEGRAIPVTISIGLTGVPAPETRKASEIVSRADKALYAAKANGRNKVVVG